MRAVSSTMVFSVTIFATVIVLVLVPVARHASAEREMSNGLLLARSSACLLCARSERETSVSVLIG